MAVTIYTQMSVPPVSTKWPSQFILRCLSPLLVPNGRHNLYSDVCPPCKYQMAVTIYTQMFVPLCVPNNNFFERKKEVHREKRGKTFAITRFKAGRRPAAEARPFNLIIINVNVVIL